MRISDWSSDVCSSDLFAQLLQHRMLRVAVGDVVEQLAGGFERGFRARNAEAVVLELPARLALHAGEGLAQAGGRLQRAFAQRGGDETGRASCRERVCQ